VRRVLGERGADVRSCDGYGYEPDADWGHLTSLYIVRISPKGLVRFRSLLQESLIGSLQIVSAFEYTLLCPVFQVDVASTSNWAS
jgi:hypothetical protein